MVFCRFLFVGVQAEVSFFLPNFDVIRTAEAEMERVYTACFGRVDEVCTVFKILHFLKSFARGFYNSARGQHYFLTC